MEAAAKLTGGEPQATRDQARLVGRYFWYDVQKASALGFAPRPTREALVESAAWLMEHPGLLTAKQRASLKPSEEVREAIARLFRA